MAMATNIGRESLAQDLLNLMAQIKNLPEVEQLERIRQFANEHLDCSWD